MGSAASVVFCEGNVCGAAWAGPATWPGGQSLSPGCGEGCSPRPAHHRSNAVPAVLRCAMQCRAQAVASALQSFMLLVFIATSGFVLSPTKIRGGWKGERRAARGSGSWLGLRGALRAQRVSAGNRRSPRLSSVSILEHPNLHNHTLLCVSCLQVPTG